MNISEECAICSFTSAIKMEVVCSCESFLSVYQTVWHHSLGDVDYVCLDTVVYKFAFF